MYQSAEGQSPASQPEEPAIAVLEQMRGTLVARLNRTLDQLSIEQSHLLEVIAKSRPRISRPTWILLGIAVAMAMGLGIAKLQSQTPFSQSLVVHVSSLMITVLAGISYLFDRSTSFYGPDQSPPQSMQDRWQEIQKKTSHVAIVIEELDSNIQSTQAVLVSLRSAEQEKESFLQLLNDQIAASSLEVNELAEKIKGQQIRNSDEENQGKKKRRLLEELGEAIRQSEIHLAQLVAQNSALDTELQSKRSLVEEQQALVAQITSDRVESEALVLQTRAELDHSFHALGLHRDKLSEVQSTIAILREEATDAKEREEFRLLQWAEESASVQKSIREDSEALTQLQRELQERRNEHQSILENIELIKLEKLQWSEELQLEIDRKRQDFGLLIQQESAHHAQIAALDETLQRKEVIAKSASDNLEILQIAEERLSQRIRCAASWLSDLQKHCEDCALAILTGNKEWSILLHSSEQARRNSEVLDQEIAFKSEQLASVSEKVSNSELELFHLATAIASMNILEEECRVELDSSREQSESVRLELSLLESQKISLSSQLVSLHTDLDNKNDAIHVSNIDLSQLTEDCAKLAAMKISMESLLDALMANSSALEDRNQKLSSDCFNNALQLDKILDDIEAINQKEKELIERIVVKGSELSQCESNLDSLEDRRKELQDILVTLTSQREESREALNELDDQLDRKSTELRSLDIQWQQLTEQDSTLRTSCEQRQSRLTELDQLSADAIHHLENVEQKVRESTEESSRLQSEILSLARQRDTLEEELHSAQLNINQILIEREQQLSFLNATNCELENHRAELQRLGGLVIQTELEHQTNRNGLEDLLEQKRSMQSELRQLEQSNEEYQAMVVKLATAQDELVSLEGRLQSSEAHLRKVYQQAKSAESQLEELQSMERDLEHRFEDKRSELQKLHLQVSSKEAELKSLQETHTKVMMDLAPEQSKLAQTQKELAILSQKREQQNKELDSLAKEAKDANEICEKWRQYQLSLEKEIQTLTKDRDHKGREIVDLESRKGESLLSLETLQRERQQQEAMQQQLRAQTEKIREECMRQEQLVDGWVAKRSQLSAECKSLQLVIEENTRLQARAESEMEAIRQNSDAWERRLDAIQLEHHNLGQAILRESDKLARMVSDSESIDEKIQLQLADLAKLNANHSSLQQEIDLKEAWVRDWIVGESNRQAARESHEAVVSELASLRERVGTLTIEIDSKVLAKQDLDQTLAAMTSEVNAAMERQQLLQTKQQEIGDRIREWSDKENQLNVHLASLEASRSQIEDTIRHLEWESGQRQLEVAQGEMRLSELQSMVHAIEAKKDKLSHELQFLQTELGSLNADIPASRVKLEELRAQITAESNKKKEMETELISVQSQLLVEERNREAIKVELVQQEKAIDVKRDLLRSLASTEELLNLRIESLRDEEATLGKVISEKSITLSELDTKMQGYIVESSNAEIEEFPSLDSTVSSTVLPANPLASMSDGSVTLNAESAVNAESTSWNQSNDLNTSYQSTQTAAADSFRSENRIVEDILADLQDLQPSGLENDKPIVDDKTSVVEREISPWDVVLG